VTRTGVLELQRHLSAYLERVAAGAVCEIAYREKTQPPGERGRVLDYLSSTPPPAYADGRLLPPVTRDPGQRPAPDRPGGGPAVSGEQYRLFQAAKKALRRDPELTDEQVAEAIGIPARVISLGGRELDTIRQARSDVAASTDDLTRWETDGGAA
jgi:hypothetical protein